MPLWDRPFIPISKSEEKLDANVSVKLTKAQARFISVVCAKGSRPEIETPSDFMRVCYQLGVEYIRRAPTTGPEIEQLARTLQLKNQIQTRKELYASYSKMLDDLEMELEACYDTSGKLLTPTRFKQTFNNLVEIKASAPSDLLPRAQALWVKYRPQGKTGSP